MNPAFTRWTDEEIDRLRELAESGIGGRAVSVALGRSYNATKVKAARYGITLRARDEFGRITYRAGQVMGQPVGESWKADDAMSEYRRRVLDGEIDPEHVERSITERYRGVRRRPLCRECGEHEARSSKTLCYRCAETLRRQTAEEAGTTDEDYRRERRHALHATLRYHERRIAECRELLAELPV